MLPDILAPDTTTWIIGPSYELAEKEFRYIHQRLVVERNAPHWKKLGFANGLPKPVKMYNSVAAGNLYMEFPWGSKVVGKSAKRPDSLLGEAVDCILYSEGAEIPRMTREKYAQPTLLTTKGREIIPTTPSMAAEWVHELYNKGLMEQFPDMDSFHWDITANPTYPIEEFERAKKFYGENNPVFREQYLGEWVFYGGLVYPAYNPATHIIPQFKIPSSWPVIRAIDPGHRDPFVCLWGAVGPMGEIYVCDEYYYTESNRSVRGHAEEIKRISEKYNIVATYMDPSGAQVSEDLAHEGISCIKANNDRQSGRLRVLEYMTLTEGGPCAYNQPRIEDEIYPHLYFFDTIKETTSELKFYRWKEGRNAEGEKESTEGADHGCDTLRYMLMSRPSPRKVSFRASINTFEGSRRHMINNKNKSKQKGFIGYGNY
jgi:hypothetical protein